MKITCQCGHEFDVEDGVDRARCPRCGQEVEVKPAEDWLSSLQVEDLSLEEEIEQPEAAAGEEEQRGRPEETAAEESEELELEKKEAGPAPQPAAPRVSAVRPAGKVREQAATRGGAETFPPPEGLLDLFKIARIKPEAALPHFETGIESRRFSIETAALFVGLSLVAGFAQAYLLAPDSFQVGKAFAHWLSILCELATAAVGLSLVCFLLKRGPKPLGTCQALAVVRVASLLVIVPICLIVGAVVMLAADGGVPGVIEPVVGHLAKGYSVMVFFGQAMLIMGMLKLGCLPGLILSLLLTYAGYAIADMLIGIF